MARYVVYLAVILSIGSGAAQADLVLDLATGSPTSVVSGSTVFIDMVLIDNDDSHFGPNAGGVGVGRGLSSGGGQIFQSAAAGTTSGAVLPNSGLDFDFTNSSAAPGGIAGALSLVALSDPAGINTGIAHIATFSVTITAAAGDTVTIMSDILPITANVVDDGTLLGTPIDADIANFGSLTFTVSAVPEPSTWLGCSLAVAGLIWRSRRSRRRHLSV